jgi:4'-phosphopantetheinyl transferase
MQHGTVHLWAWDFACSPGDRHHYITLLSSDEQARMQKFRFEKDRIRYAISHAILRILLGRYLDLPPSSICFEKNEFGKPHLAPAFGAPELAFNLSHSNRVGLLAIANGLAVGVDVEEIRPVERDTVERYFSAQEQASLADLTGMDWLEGFYNCWTRKEAILKAEGTGLNARLDAFDVSLSPGVKAEVLCVRRDRSRKLTQRLTCSDPESEITPQYDRIWGSRSFHLVQSSSVVNRMFSTIDVSLPDLVPMED